MGVVDDNGVRVRTCALDCCDSEPGWCGLCMSHCNGDEEHNVIPSHYDDPVLCECGWEVVWIMIFKKPGVAGRPIPLEVRGGDAEIQQAAETNPDHIFFYGPFDLFKTFRTDASALIRASHVHVGDARYNGANPGATT